MKGDSIISNWPYHDIITMGKTFVIQISIIKYELSPLYRNLWE